MDYILSHKFVDVVTSEVLTILGSLQKDFDKAVAKRKANVSQMGVQLKINVGNNRLLRTRRKKILGSTPQYFISPSLIVIALSKQPRHAIPALPSSAYSKSGPGTLFEHKRRNYPS